MSRDLRKDRPMYVCACVGVNRSICPRLPEGAIFDLSRESRSDLGDLDGLDSVHDVIEGFWRMNAFRSGCTTAMLNSR